MNYDSLLVYGKFSWKVYTRDTSKFPECGRMLKHWRKGSHPKDRWWRLFMWLCKLPLFPRQKFPKRDTWVCTYTRNSVLQCVFSRKRQNTVEGTVLLGLPLALTETSAACWLLTAYPWYALQVHKYSCSPQKRPFLGPRTMGFTVLSWEFPTAKLA